MTTAVAEVKNCSCTDCQNACAVKPGWFLPGEAEKAAEAMGVSLKEFFDTYLAVDWIVAAEVPDADLTEDVFLLAPAVVESPAGEEYPGDPRGRCVFFQDDGTCGIYEQRPHECRSYIHTEDHAEVTARHTATGKAWASHQQQIRDLLGRDPETSSWYGGGLLGSLFGSLFSGYDDEDDDYYDEEDEP